MACIVSGVMVEDVDLEEACMFCDLLGIGRLSALYICAHRALYAMTAE
jgi:hypothetical protein